MAVRAVWECRAAFPETAIVGVGGVGTGVDAVELLQAGADAVQVGTATFRDPRAPWKVLRQLARWCRTHDTSVAELRTAARRRSEREPSDARPGTATAAPDAPVDVMARPTPAPLAHRTPMENGGRHG